MHANRVKHVHHARCILKKQGLLGGKLDISNNDSAVCLLDGKKKKKGKKRNKDKGRKKRKGRKAGRQAGRKERILWHEKAVSRTGNSVTFI